MIKNKMRKLSTTKKAMSTFEIIGYAVLAIVVVIVAIVIFTKLTSGPSKTIGGFSDNSNQNTNDCIKNPSTCDPLKQNTQTKTNVQNIIEKVIVIPIVRTPL